MDEICALCRIVFSGKGHATGVLPVRHSTPAERLARELENMRNPPVYKDDVSFNEFLRQTTMKAKIGVSGGFKINHDTE